MKIFVPLLAGCLIATHAVAGEAPATPRLQAATQLLNVMDAQRAAAAGFSTMADVMIKANPMLAPYRSVILQWAHKYMSWQQMGPQLATLYASAFTRAQLQDLIRFYQTPTGQEAVRLLPELAQEGAVIGEAMARQHLPQLREMLKTRTAQLTQTPSNH